MRSLVATLIAVGGISPFTASADGLLDPAFGSGGIVTTAFTGASGTVSAVAFGAAVQGDGRIVAVGTGSDIATPVSSNDIAVARYNADGSLDATFGALGQVGTHLGGIEVAYAVTVQPDQRILVAGSANAPDQMFVVRYLANGFLDPSFGTGGVVRPTLPGGPTAFAVRVDGLGRVLLAGPSGLGPTQFTVVRLGSNGTVDTDFGVLGVAMVDPSGNGTGGYLYDMELQPDGAVVATGYTVPDGVNIQVAVCRFQASGAPDGTFGTGGCTRTDVGPGTDVGWGVAIQADGKIVIGGYGNLAGTNDLLALRYTTNGVLDSSFGLGGIATSGLPSADEGRTLVVQADGNVVVGGFDGDFLLARLTPGGILDSTFGTGGVVRTDVGAAEELHQVLVSEPGRLLAVGRSDGTQQRFALARYVAMTPVTLQEFAVQ
jgi:uncharacterized delta-60 repeat protein